MIDCRPIGEASHARKPKRLLEMENGDPGIDARRPHTVDEPIVEIDPRLVQPSGLREDPAPPDRKTISVDAKIAQMPDVFLVPAIVVAGKVAICAVLDRASPVGKFVPIRGACPVCQGRALDLVRGAGRTPHESFRESYCFHGGLIICYADAYG